jgi:hypothetical protein
MWGLWWTKQHWGRFSPSTSVSLANDHFTKFPIIIKWGWHNRPIGGRSAEWTQLDSVPHHTKLKKKTCFFSLLSLIFCSKSEAFDFMQIDLPLRIKVFGC